MQIPPWQTGAFVRKLRLEHGLTQRQLARLAGDSFDDRDIRRLERGMFGGMRPDRLQRVLDVLESDLRALYRWSLFADEMSPLALDWQFDMPIPSQVYAVVETRRDLEQARQRLRDVMLASQATCYRSTELLAVSQKMLDGNTSPTEPKVRGLTHHC